MRQRRQGPGDGSRRSSVHIVPGTRGRRKIVPRAAFLVFCLLVAIWGLWLVERRPDLSEAAAPGTATPAPLIQVAALGDKPAPATSPTALTLPTAVLTNPTEGATTSATQTPMPSPIVTDQPPPPTPAPTDLPPALPVTDVSPVVPASETAPVIPVANLLLAFDTVRDGNEEVYLFDAGTGTATNLSRHPADDRAPAWRPDGGAIAFQSHRDGNWEIVVLDLATGVLTRLTDHPAYDGSPAWSPDGSEIAFESVRDGNLDVYIVPAGGGSPRRLTQSGSADYDPAWSPDGTLVAFTSWRDGNKEVYVVPAAGGEARNVTQHPADDEDPAWSPDGGHLAFVSWRDVDPITGNRNAELYQIRRDGGSAERLTNNVWPDVDPAWEPGGRLTWAAYEPGPPFETYDPYRPGDFHLYYRGDSGPQTLTHTGWDDRRPAPAPPGVALDALEARLPPLPPPPEPSPILAPGTLAQVVEVPGVLTQGRPVLANALVVPSLLAWKQAMIEASGYDFLARTLGTWRNIETVRRRKLYQYDYGYLSWHKTGRALDLALELKVNGADQMLVVREDLGPSVFWRMYLRAARQDGSQGEPLTDNPWQFWWHIVPAEDPEAYEAGGRRLPIPSGYFVDVTAIAKRYGWERIASYAIDGDYHWHHDSNGAEYWHYERTDGLLWWDAMRQIYPLETLQQHVSWEVALGKLQSEDMLRCKGIPAP